MDLAQHVCKEAALPICKVLKMDDPPFVSSSKTLLGITIQSPYTLALILISILCAIRMITHVNALYASIGRGEMRTFFSIYIASGLLSFILIGFGEIIPSYLCLILTVLQSGVQSTMFFALFAAGFTIDRIYGIFGIKSSTFMRILSGIYFGIITAFIFVCCTINNEAVILLVIAINTLSLIFYILMQSSRLRKINSDIWAYGILIILLATFFLSVLNLFVGAKFIAVVSERNLDSLFLHLVFTFLFVMMVHKYWLSTCDFELECLALCV